MEDELRLFDKHNNICHNTISRNIQKDWYTMKLDSNAHSVFLLYYHLVLVVKYRRKVFDNTISDRAKEIIESQGEKH